MSIARLIDILKVACTLLYLDVEDIHQFYLKFFKSDFIIFADLFLHTFFTSHGNGTRAVLCHIVYVSRTPSDSSIR